MLYANPERYQMATKAAPSWNDRSGRSGVQIAPNIWAYKGYRIEKSGRNFYVTKPGLGFTIATVSSFVDAQSAVKEFMSARKKNPRTRSTGSVRRPSQATKRKPSARLVKRRIATKKAPRGFFANPKKKFGLSAKSTREWMNRDQYKFSVVVRGHSIANFRTLKDAREYGQAYANAHKCSVGVSSI